MIEVVSCGLLCFFFFFLKKKTAYEIKECDWSSDVCSSDLFIELAGHVNGHMPDHVVDLVGEALNRQGKAVRGSRVLVLGVAYKADIDDVRESPSLDIMQKLAERGARIDYTDPYVPSIRFAGGEANARN